MSAVVQQFERSLTLRFFGIRYVIHLWRDHSIYPEEQGIPTGLCLQVNSFILCSSKGNKYQLTRQWPAQHLLQTASLCLLHIYIYTRILSRTCLENPSIVIKYVPRDHKISPLRKWKSQFKRKVHVPLNPFNHHMRQRLDSCFTDGKTEAQGDDVKRAKSYSSLAVEPEWKPHPFQTQSPCLVMLPWTLFTPPHTLWQPHLW